MAKGDKGFERDQIQQQNTKSDSLYQNYYDTLNNERPDLKKQADSERDYLTGGFKNFAEGGALSPEDEARLRAIGGGGGGSAFNPSAYVNKLNDPNRLSDVRDTVSRLKSFKAFSPDDVNEIQRKTYKDLEANGGYDDASVRRMKQSAGAVVPSFYSSLKDQMGRGLAVQGSNAGQGAANFRLVRDASKAATDASLNSDLSIQDKINAGKLTGADRLSQNQLQMRSIGAPLEMQGLEQAGNLGLGVAGEERQGWGDAYGMEHTFQEENNANARSAAAGNSALEKYIIDARNQGKMYGLDSLDQLYGQTPGQLSQNDKLRLDALGQRGNEMQGWRNTSLYNDSVNRSQILPTIASIAGAGGGILGAFGGESKASTNRNLTKQSLSMFGGAGGPW